MKIKNQKITITQGDSFEIPFVLSSGSDDTVASFNTGDKVYFVLQPYGDCCDLLVKEITTFTDSNTKFTVSVDKDDSAKLMPGRYEYGVYVENGTSRLTLIKPTEFTIERGV